ncbi:MAG: NHLP leader peptide family RiPP precursor [Schwartzia sp.]|nr:NHLP leader peptide family RiPP precursor [Schwartzia sp. (in: firmicutes)]
MMEWTKEEMEKLYIQMQKKAMTDEAFRKDVLADANKALEKLAGKKLPEGMKFKVIEKDPAYTATFVLPDFVSEELDMAELDKTAGGISALLILSACAVAIGTGPCPAEACGAKLQVS